MVTLEEKKHWWEEYTYHGRIHENVPEAIAISWKKCRQANVDPFDGRGKRVSEAILDSILKENKWLMEIAEPIMQNLFNLVMNSHFLLVITDSCGYILDTIGDTDVNKKAENLRFERGMLWSDEEVGSNAIGIALDQNLQIQMAGADHYCLTHHEWTCAAAPIHGLDGQVVGCINISGNAEEMHCHSLGIVAAAAFAIETQIRQRHSYDLMYTALNSSSDGIILLDLDFRSIWMNEAAKNILGTSLDELGRYDFRKIMTEFNWENEERWKSGRPSSRTDCKLKLNDQIFGCSASVSPILSDGRVTGFSVSFNKLEALFKTVNKVTGNHASYTFDDIYFKDPLMGRTLQMAQKYAKYDGCILIEGESGTGKELFAQAIHNASSRSEGPFVAVNSSSLPRDLVESELFGYERGAFTGALKEGKPGKFELADHGTIFLDEIGEMPLEFQAKLLRVAQLHSVQRLGGKYEKKLDLRIIVATNRNLKEEVLQKRFREDLYFRFNVLKLNIPPLRERPEDIACCAQRFLNHFNDRYPDQKKEITEGFIRSLQAYDWPGNVRELQNYIEKTFYLSQNTFLSDQIPLVDSGEPVGLEQTEKTRNRKAGLTLEQIETENIMEMLKDCGGSVELAAERLAISRAALYRRLKKYGINTRELRGKTV
ncbi:sigma-54-dependent Fis family transcriptional regulator [Anoxybacterium hadale]|uniref:sigma-54-dependent Fis family transcriptional regulator n=1 Tax=Anoxybacterium hadale TaxID=3408580 RepID=UPI003B009C0B